MKRIVALIGSRRKNGNTVAFVRSILNDLSNEKYETEYLFPQDFNISPCMGCGRCFEEIECAVHDELPLLQKKILDSDLLVIASPVYLHYMTADLQLILEKSAWWTHTLRLQGKPIVVVSTCHSNGHRKVTEALSQMMTYMGGNVIATVNGSQFPNQLNNETWLKSIILEINQRIIKFSEIAPQSNDFLEKLFINLKQDMTFRSNMTEQLLQENGEVRYWKENGLIKYNSFAEYLLSLSKSQSNIKETVSTL